MTKIYAITQETTPWHDLSMTAQIVGNTFEGTLNAKDVELGGTVSGGFFGPGAEEVGGSWAVDNADEHAIGEFIGR